MKHMEITHATTYTVSPLSSQFKLLCQVGTGTVGGSCLPGHLCTQCKEHVMSNPALDRASPTKASFLA